MGENSCQLTILRRRTFIKNKVRYANGCVLVRHREEIGVGNVAVDEGLGEPTRRGTVPLAAAGVAVPPAALPKAQVGLVCPTEGPGVEPGVEDRCAHGGGFAIILTRTFLLG